MSLVKTQSHSEPVIRSCSTVKRRHCSCLLAAAMAAAGEPSPAAVLARNQLSSLLSALPDALSSDAEAQRRLRAQLPAVRNVLLRHNVLGRVRDGKALAKFHARVLQLIDAPGLEAAGWELARVVVSQSAVDTVEQLAQALQACALKSVKALASAKHETDDEDKAAVAGACQVSAVAIRNVERFAPDVRRDLMDVLAKQLVPALLSSVVALLGQSECSAVDQEVCTQALKLLNVVLDTAPSSMRSHATKIESASVAALFRVIEDDLDITDVSLETASPLVRAAAECISKVPAASDKPLAAWIQMVEKATEALHSQLDLVAGKRTTTDAASSSSAPANLKIWMRHASSSSVDTSMTALERGDTCALLVSRGADALTALFASPIVSEREIQAVIVDTVALARRALAVRAHEVGKHTGVSEDGTRLPVSVVYGVLPNVHASSLTVLGRVVGRAGICSLRYAGRISRTLQLAVEGLRLEAGAGYNIGGTTLGTSCSRALYDTIAVCVSAMGASTIERLGVPILSELVAQCQTQFVDPAPVTNSQASGTSSNNDKKGKKRKRQNASSVPDVSILSAGQAADVYVSAHDREVRASNAHAALAAVATCVAVYGSLLPEEDRRVASDVALLASTSSSRDAADRSSSAVALAMLTDSVTCDASSAHATNVLAGLDSWQQMAVRRASNVGASSNNRSTDSLALSMLLPLAALNAGEALLHPRAPPFVVNAAASREDDASIASKLLKQPSNGSSLTSFPTRRGAKSTPVRGDANDWHSTEVKKDQSSKEVEEDDEEHADESSAPAVVEDDQEHVGEQEEEEEEDDYDDARPTKKVNSSSDEDDDDDSDGGKESVQTATTASVAKAKEEDDDDDDFPDIVMDDEDDE